MFVRIWNDAWLHVFWGLTERDRLLARSIRSAGRYARIEFNLPISTMYEAIKQARLTDLADQLHAFWIFVNLTSAQVKPSGVSGFVGADGKSMVQFPFTIVDMKPECRERYEVSFPGIFEDNVDYRLDFKCMQVGLSLFDNWFRKNHANYDRIILCLNDDAANMREALRIREILQEELADDDEMEKKEIFIRVQNPKLSESLVFGETCNGRVAIKTFGDMIRLYSVRSFYSEKVDRVAAVMNWRWHKNCDEDVLRLDEGREFHKDLQDEITRYWIDDPLYNRRSSRIQALRCMTFCRMKGWTIDQDEYGQDRLMTERSDGNAVCDENGNPKKVPIRYEALRDWINALLGDHSVLHRIERRRWCTYMRVSGYRSFAGKESELAGLKQRGCGKFVPNQLKDFRRHAGLNDLDDDAPVVIQKNTSCWRVFADAALLAGYCERNVLEAEAGRLSWWKREKMAGRSLR